MQPSLRAGAPASGGPWCTTAGAVQPPTSQCQAREGKLRKQIRGDVQVVAAVKDTLEQVAQLSNVRVELKIVKWKKIKSSIGQELSLMRTSSRLVVGKGKRKISNPRQLVDIGAKQTGSTASKARAAKCVKSVVLEAIRATAMSRLIAQEALMIAEVESFDHSPPVWSTDVPISDSASESVTVCINGITVEATWHLYVQTTDFAWGVLDTDGQTMINKHLKTVVPPLPCTGASAEQMHRCRTEHPFVRPIRTFRDALHSKTTQCAMELPCEDSASSNIKLAAAEMIGQ